MKKLHLLSFLCAAAVAANAQTKFFEKTTYAGAFGATDWTSGWANWTPGTTTYPATTDVLSGEITSNMTLDASKVYLLSGFVYVRNGATLTIPAGTVIRGDKATKATLIITRGSKLVANGTKNSPIVFTSNQASGSRDYGDWGGVIILGAAPVNPTGGTATIEGGVNNANQDGAYGGTNADDNSGSMTYCRLEFGGVAFQPDNEINGLTLGGVGRGTKMSYIQVSYSGDDAIEWFGGNVDMDHLIAFRSWDDCFDTDFGYSGRVQFGVSLGDPMIADKSGSNGYECDNDGTGSDNSPFTNATFSNMTVIGPGANADLNNSSTFNANWKRGMHIRRNSRVSVFNSIFIGYPTGLLLDGDKTVEQAITGGQELKGVIIACSKKSLDTASIYKQHPTFNISTWFNTSAYKNQVLTNCIDAKLGSYSLTAPNFLPQSGSPLLDEANVDFTSARLQPLNTQGIDEVFSGNGVFTVYPNPASSVANVDFYLNRSANVTVSIMDINGKVISSETQSFNGGDNSYTLNTSSLNNGLYLVMVAADGYSAVQKVIISK